MYKSIFLYIASSLTLHVFNVYFTCFEAHAAFLGSSHPFLFQLFLFPFFLLSQYVFFDLGVLFPQQAGMIVKQFSFFRSRC
mmetsp:Transcript_9398/g.16002  ORF Transcript_9398/g.16002 Transcript_9398/m.16002 type:complete len:81 (+) Transcript_9398:25-267(+)